MTRSSGRCAGDKRLTLRAQEQRAGARRRPVDARTVSVAPGIPRGEGRLPARRCGVDVLRDAAAALRRRRHRQPVRRHPHRPRRRDRRRHRPRRVSGNLDVSRTNPSMFEPVHGSAPDIAGQGIADPTATVLSVGDAARPPRLRRCRRRRSRRRSRRTSPSRGDARRSTRRSARRWPLASPADAVRSECGGASAQACAPGPHPRPWTVLVRPAAAGTARRPLGRTARGGAARARVSRACRSSCPGSPSSTTCPCSRRTHAPTGSGWRRTSQAVAERMAEESRNDQEDDDECGEPGPTGISPEEIQSDREQLEAEASEDDGGAGSRGGEQEPQPTRYCPDCTGRYVDNPLRRTAARHSATSADVSPNRSGSSASRGSSRTPSPTSRTSGCVPTSTTCWRTGCRRSGRRSSSSRTASAPVIAADLWAELGDQYRTRLFLTAGSPLAVPLVRRRLHPRTAEWTQNLPD